MNQQISEAEKVRRAIHMIYNHMDFDTFLIAIDQQYGKHDKNLLNQYVKIFKSGLDHLEIEQANKIIEWAIRSSKNSTFF